LWRCGDDLFFEVPPLASNAFLVMLHPLLKTCCGPFAASFRRIVGLAVLTFHVPLCISKVLPPLENHSLSHCIISIGLMAEL
jgi:hypothetical protein